MEKKKKSLLESILPGIIGGGLFIVFAFLLNLNIFLSIGIGIIGYISGYLLFASRKKEIEVIFEGISEDEYNEIMKNGLEKLGKMRSYLTKVSNAQVKSKIKGIGDVVEKIFDDIRKDPKDIRPARQFLNYYLDTTINILNRYVDISSRDINSKKIKESLLRVENLLDTIKLAFEKQLEKLLSDDILDLDTDIELLEKTIKMEGIE